MKKTELPLADVYRALLAAWGPQHWWPGRTRLEVIVGAILTQNTAWSNVEKAIRRLRKEKAINLDALRRAREPVLADWIRPAGYFRVKARRLKAFVRTMWNQYGGSLDRLFALDTPALRNALLEVHGIGPETADSILLYAAGRPVFVVDAYTRRFLVRHRWARPGATYDEIAGLFTRLLLADVQMYNEFHALIVRLGKEHCRARARCEGCPLSRWPVRAEGAAA